MDKSALDFSSIFLHHSGLPILGAQAFRKKQASKITAFLFIILSYETAGPERLTTRSIDAGYFNNLSARRIGRIAKLPPQLGHVLFKTFVTQLLQKVHSKVQIIASADSGGKSLSQHSQFGRSSNMISPKLSLAYLSAGLVLSDSFI